MIKRINNEPPLWGDYGSAAAFYASPEWLEIVEFTLANHRIMLGLARRCNDAEAIKFLTVQIKACEQALGISAAKREAANPAQASLFNSLLGIK